MWLMFGDSEDTPNGFFAGLIHILVWIDIEPSLVAVTAGVVILAICVTLATYGVMEVLHVKLGGDYHRVLLSLMSPRNGKLKRYASKLFMVPDIIDVNDVTVEPRSNAGFDTIIFKATLKSVFIVGTVISSYLFLNPVFLQSIPFHEMILIIMLLSFFIPALVVPYILTMDLQALAHSKGNRPFRLWIGYRNKMFRTGFYVALFLTLLWVCLFTGEDMFRILISYVSYMAFLVLSSLLVAYIFVNTFLGSMAMEVADKLEMQKMGITDEGRK